MSWDRETSAARIAEHLDRMAEIEITKLIRDTEDLVALLSESKCREIEGPHIYAEVSNFTNLVSELTDDGLRRAIRALHVFERNVTSIVEKLFDAIFVHWQGPRLHALIYRPVGREQVLAAKAVLLQLVIADFTTSVFNPLVTDIADFRVRSGSATGTAIGTRNGMNRDREMLFVGDPANLAAHAISGSARACIDATIERALPKALGEHVQITPDGHRIIRMTSYELDALLHAYGIAYDRDDYREAVRADLDDVPIRDIKYEDAEVLIDFSPLSVRRNKRVFAASVFADIDGFTAKVHAARHEDEKKKLLRAFAAVRKELAYVVKRDYSGKRIQYQGDRQQSLHHLPRGDQRAIAEDALQSAVGQMSSFELTLKDAVPELRSLKLAIGVDMGTTIASRLGDYGQRDRICIGEATYDSAAIQEQCSGDEIGISKAVYGAIRLAWQKLFKWDDRGFYIARGLRADDLEYADAKRDFGKDVYVTTGATAVVSSSVREGSRKVTPSRSWADEA